MISPDNKDMSIVKDNEIAYILSKFNTDFIYVTVTEALQCRLRYYDSVNPNIVSGYEVIFKQAMEEYPNIIM